MRTVVVSLVACACAWALAPPPVHSGQQRTRVVVAAETDLVPLVAAGGVAALAVGAAVMGGMGGGPPAAPASKPKPKAAPVAAPAVAAPVKAEGGLVKACWSGDAFKGFEWPTTTAPTVESWRSACDADGVTSYWDYGVRVIDWTPPPPTKAVTVGDWLATCESQGVVSFYDFGLRLA